MRTKKILSFLLTLTMVLALVPAFTVSSFASITSPPEYLYPVYNTDGDPSSGINEWETGTCNSFTLLQSTTTETRVLDAGWYVVDGDVTLSKGAVCNGAVNLILMDGCNLTVNGTNYNAGITVSGDANSLTIYAQEAGTGTLTATGATYGAGIGGNGGWYTNGGIGSNITINGGKVTANGGAGAAGIGGGAGIGENWSAGDAKNIVINGGVVVAVGKENSSGIGCSYGSNKAGNVEYVFINGGEVTAYSENCDGIGGGYGTGYIIGGQDPNAIGAGNSSNIMISRNVIVKAGATANPTEIIENTGSDLASSLADKKYVTIVPKTVPTASDFVYTAPENLVYDGNAKIATVTPSAVATSMGAITAVKYYKDGDTTTYSAIATDVGTYVVKIDVAESAYYTAATDLTDPDNKWTFTITAAPVYVADDPTYAVTTETAQNGKVTLSKTNAYSGNTVTITVTPDKGYTLETLTVLDKNGKEIEVTAVKVGTTYTFKMPSGKVTVKATFMEDNTMLNYFFDVTAQDYFYDAVLWAAENGITAGKGDSKFAPHDTCTRAEFVTFLWRAAGKPTVDYAIPFTDVTGDHYYTEALRWAASMGIVKGTTLTTFSPDQTINRAQAVTYLARYAGVDDNAAATNKFTDVASDAYYVNAVAWAAENGITSGTTATTFAPKNDCQRAHTVVFLYNYFNK